MNVFEARNVKHYYGERLAVDIESLNVESGSITGLFGSNGSGKTTLLKLLAFIEKPISGDILFKGRSLVSNKKLRPNNIALLPQEPYLLKRTVYENAAYGLFIRKMKTGVEQQVRQSLEMVGLMFDQYAGRKWYELSGGEARRVALASRLVLKPEVLLLDEPTAGVDAAATELIKDASVKARDEWGTTLIMASHDGEWLHALCDDVRQMHNGRIIGSGRETLIFGPWIEKDDHIYGKPLTHDQYFFLSSPKPIGRDATVLLNPDGMSLFHKNREDIPPNMNILRGQLTQLAFDKRGCEVIAAVQVGRTVFNIRLMREKAASLNLTPGETVLIGYRLDCAGWLD